MPEAPASFNQNSQIVTLGGATKLGPFVPTVDSALPYPNVNTQKARSTGWPIPETEIPMMEIPSMEIPSMEIHSMEIPMMEIHMMEIYPPSYDTAMETSNVAICYVAI